MAIPTTKATFKSYCLRALGSGVIDINISDDQADDRIDEALQYFSQYHYDSVERMYLKHLITTADIARARADVSTTGTDNIDSSVTATWKEGTNYIPVPDAVVSVLEVFPFYEGSTSNMFDVRYQMRLNDLYDFSSTSVLHYNMTMQHIDFLQHSLVGEVPIRFNQHQNRLYLDMDWANDVAADQDYILIDCYRKLDPTSYSDIYDDVHLKRYATCLIKKQWGANLSKFKGVTMLGGIEMDGETLFTQALEEQQRLEEAIANMQYPDLMIKG
jgi:hypothetical protein|tara:strand:+ start:168 stop:983 length:816 start_codon:yes stop_codon:yes gene_type:complete